MCYIYNILNYYKGLYIYIIVNGVCVFTSAWVCVIVSITFEVFFTTTLATACSNVYCQLSICSCIYMQLYFSHAQYLCTCVYCVLLFLCLFQYELPHDACSWFWLVLSQLLHNGLHFSLLLKSCTQLYKKEMRCLYFKQWQFLLTNLRILLFHFPFSLISYSFIIWPNCLFMSSSSLQVVAPYFLVKNPYLLLRRILRTRGFNLLSITWRPKVRGKC